MREEGKVPEDHENVEEEQHARRSVEVPHTRCRLRPHSDVRGDEFASAGSVDEERDEVGVEADAHHDEHEPAQEHARVVRVDGRSRLQSPDPRRQLPQQQRQAADYHEEDGRHHPRQVRVAFGRVAFVACRHAHWTEVVAELSVHAPLLFVDEEHQDEEEKQHEDQVHSIEDQVGCLSRLAWHLQHDDVRQHRSAGDGEHHCEDVPRLGGTYSRHIAYDPAHHFVLRVEELDNLLAHSGVRRQTVLVEERLGRVCVEAPGLAQREAVFPVQTNRFCRCNGRTASEAESNVDILERG